MADLRDEHGNPIYLTDQNGYPAQLVNEYGEAMHLTGVATTTPHLKETTYTGPHPITAPVTTTNTPYHAHPITAVTTGTTEVPMTEESPQQLRRDPVEAYDFHWSGSSSSLSEEDGQGGHITDKIKLKLRGNKHKEECHEQSGATATATGSVQEPREKKSIFYKIKEKFLSHHHNKP